MFETILDLPDEAATAALGAALGRTRARGDVIALVGPLGAGKTALARAYIAEATGTADAPSPTFGLVHRYDAPDGPIHHFDLYRLERPGDVWELGLEDALEDGVCLIEWPERIADWLPPSTLLVELTISGAGRRARLRGAASWRDRLAAIADTPGQIAVNAKASPSDE
ncbi:MAG: tRNA (adenosine(37)-N6)-threonylcarbamoyltransferase complex ATPase subunit type 1 TsaE [Pseudomonadota bacterium]